MRWPLLILPLTVALGACSQRPSARAPTWDTPIPAAEPREQVELRLDLEPVSDCDERFDLALYDERGVELVTWDEQKVAGRRCSERRVTVRYVKGRITREALLARARQVSRKVEVIER